MEKRRKLLLSEMGFGFVEMRVELACFEELKKQILSVFIC